MNPLSITPEDMKVIKAFNKNIEWLKAQSIKEKPEAWVSYEDACKVLPRSKQWYQYNRMGFTDRSGTFHAPTLFECIDWRRVGGVIEYRLQSIISLKNSLIHVA